MRLRELLRRAKAGSLADKCQSRHLSWMLAAASVMFAAGISLPILETKFLLSSNRHSLISVVYELFAAKDYFLAFVITAFSIVLPFGKLFMLAIVYSVPVGSLSPLLLWLLDSVSKWAMLDVLVVALFIFSLKSAPFANALTMPGVYLFTLAVLISHYVSGRIVKALQTHPAVL